MVKEEIRRITNLVKEGKLSPEDAADLIEAFTQAGTAAHNGAAHAQEPTEHVEESAAQTESRSEAPPPPPGEGVDREPFRSLVESIERLGKEMCENVDWDGVAQSARQQAQKGLQTLKASFEQIARGDWGLFASQETREITLPLSASAGKALRVENPAGTVRIHGGQAEGSVRATARIRGRDAEDARKKADSYSLVIEEGDTHVTVRQPELSGLTVDLEIYLIDALPVEVRTQSGDISVLGVGDSAKIQTQSGDVKVRGAKGVVDINLHSGDLTLEDVDSPALTIENKTGNVVLKNVHGNVNARSASGQFSMRACTGKTVVIESVTGDVRLDLAQAIDGAVSVRTVNGNAAIMIEDGSDCRVALSTLRGTVVCDLDLQDVAKQDQQRITGRIGEGKGAIDVSAVNGDIVLRLRDHSEATTDTSSD